jgi:uncharacterized membrane protein YdjX (TVP38/TMEM64 family)
VAFEGPAVVDILVQLDGAIPGQLGLALALFALTSTLVAAGIPGTTVPLSVSSGALLGGGLGMAVILAGVLAGSQALFLIARHALSERMRRRLGGWLEPFERRVGGIAYVIALRLGGAPHFLVTVGSALARLRPTHFALATLIGVAPAISVAAMAGAAL